MGVGLGAGGSPAAAFHSSGPDYCTTNAGVTVVVDMTEFGDGIVVRCVDGPLPSGYDGWDALADAGFSPVSPSRVPGFVCRLAGEPAASRTLDIPENPSYHEQCVNTPPTSAYWGYWSARNGGIWTYSTAGAASRPVIEGGFEGWAFSLDSGDSPPRPGVAPSHPVTTPTTPPTSGSPHTGGSGHHHPSGGGGTPSTPTTSDPTSSPATGSGDGNGNGNDGDGPHHGDHAGGPHGRHHQGDGQPTTDAPTTTAPTTTAPTPTATCR